MRRVLGWVISLLAILPMPALAAGNFAFAVTAPRGITLNIAGYAEDGSEMFRQRSGPIEQHDGKPAYIVRVDETIIRSKRLAKWCVSVAIGQWDAMPKGAAELCDEKPTETRGTYVFAATPQEPATQTATTVAEDVAEPLRCAAAILRETGYLVSSPGLAREEALRRAAIRFVAMQAKDPGLPALSEDTGDEWCSQLEKMKAAGIEQPPTLFEKLHFGPDVSIAVARDTVAGLKQATSYFDVVAAYRLKYPPAIYISADADWMTAGYAAETYLPADQVADRKAQFAACRGGEANFGMMFMCTESKVFSEDSYGAGHTAQRAYALAHEWFHVMQNDAVGAAPSGCCNEAQQLSRMGPTWLIEGAAEYMAMRLLADSKRMDWQKEMQNQAEHAARADVGANKLETRSDFYSNPNGAAVGVAAVRELLGSIGAEALPRYWQALGAGVAWQAAFGHAFGVGPDEFYSAKDRRVAKYVTPQEMVMCVQDALNRTGFDAGPVDGALGRGTKAAFAAYVEKNPIPGKPNGWELDTDSAATVCLFLHRELGLEGDVSSIADRLALQANIAVNVGADPESIAEIAILDGDRNELVRTDIHSIRHDKDGNPAKEFRIPYPTVRDGARVCFFAAEGWTVRGTDGKAYRGSCNDFNPSFLGVRVMLPMERDAEAELSD